MLNINQRNKPFIRFMISCIGLYILWYFLYDLWIHPNKWLDYFVIDQLKSFSENLLSIMGYDLINYQSNDPDIKTVGIDGSHGVWIGNPCNGISLFALFTGFIISFPGKFINKIIFIPIGITMIHLINGLRVTVLAMLSYYNPEMLEFNHNYTFTIIVYCFVFLLWYFWVKGWNKKVLFK